MDKLTNITFFIWEGSDVADETREVSSTACPGDREHRSLSFHCCCLCDAEAGFLAPEELRGYIGTWAPQKGKGRELDKGPVPE